ncbi:MAG: YabP/YqfC family sporulation protein [Defluviitaleaceae bacterium]|nr:YabP/YqfC family sporulation protein [Defluviitaleaceae bacterium]MCL2836837.1 YabP/YqfC family sporulation protein [Defluviitaleaceae bacterium]
MERLSRQLVEMFELPREVVFNLPIIQALGAEEISVTNYKGLVEYTAECVRVNTAAGLVRFEGSSLILRHVTSESLSVAGRIAKIEFIT